MTSETPTILHRKAVNSDVLQLASLWCALKQEERAYLDEGEPSAMKGIARMSAALADGSTFIGVLEDTSCDPHRLVGFILCQAHPLSGDTPQTGSIPCAYIEPQYRNRHKSIWRKVERWASESGILKLQFQSLYGNPYMEHFAKSRATPVAVLYEMNLNPESDNGRRRERSQQGNTGSVGTPDSGSSPEGRGARTSTGAELRDCALDPDGVDAESSHQRPPCSAATP